MKRLGFILLLTLISATLLSQTTKVRGRVTEEGTGEPIPFAGIYFKGTTIGLTTDLDGRYTLETRDPSAKVLVCQLLGYDVQEKEIKRGAFTTVNFVLKPTDNRLTGSFVKADNKRIKRLLANIDANRDRNDPERRPLYICDVYNKMELDLTHAREQLRGKRFVQEFGFVFDYIDTSVVSGVPYLPVMISEAVTKRRHTLNPLADNETVVANQISGVNPDNNLLSQFSGSMHLKTNFYQPFINSFGVEFPSPIQNGGLLFYNYYIIDSLQVDGRKTYKVRYHPKEGISSPAFDGEMHIDAEEYALQSVHAVMKRGGNVNWLRDIVLDVKYKRMPDGTWFYDNDKMYADFSIALGDSSKMMSVIGTRDLTFRNPSFDSLDIAIDRANGPVKVNRDSNHKDEAYWASVRPYELSAKEKGIYRMVEEIKDVPLYKSLENVVYTIVNGYWDVGPIGFGPIVKTISFNNMEKFRMRLGLHTSAALSKKWRWTGYAAYGFGDHSWKGGLSWERMFSKEPTHKLTLDAHYDIVQLGRGQSELTTDNFLASIFRGEQRLCPELSFLAKYEHEFSLSFNAQADISAKRYLANGFVPMNDWNGNPVGALRYSPLGSVATNEVHLKARFSKDETVNRGHFIKKYLHTKHPVFSVDLTGGIPGLRPGDYGFFRPEVSMDWTFRLAPAGISSVHIDGGTIIGKVPYPLLHLHEANATWIRDKTAFSCLDYFEFVSDTWATLRWNHNFNGFFLGKIPLLRKLQLREEFQFRMAYGTLRDENNGSAPEYGALMQFPSITSSLGGVPYMEIGAGISNIFRLFRVDCIWRLTHRDTARRVFTVNFGIEFKF